MVDAKARFSATVENYRRYRPDYPDALIRWCLGRVPRAPLAVVDLGAGTGIASRQLARAGARVTGVEPNDAMREAAIADSPPEIRYVAGEAAATGLPAGSADLVVAAQAFHWFELDPTLREIARVLVPDGVCVAFWNVRLGSPLLEAFDALLLAFSSEYRRDSTALPVLDRLAAHPWVADAEDAAFAHAQVLDRAGLHGRAWSGSYAAHGVADAAGFDAALDELFDRYAEGGVVRFTYRTIARAFRVRPA